MFFINAKALITGDFDAPTPQSVFIDLATLAIDRTTIYSRSLPGQHHTVTSIGSIQIRGCRDVQTSELTEGMLRANADGLDQYGQKIGGCSLGLISKTNIGLGFSIPLGPDCKKDVALPQGGYLAVTNAYGAETDERDIRVENDTDFNIALKPAYFKMLATPTPGEVTPIPTLDATINPARDLTGKWTGTASFEEDNIFTRAAAGEVLCSWAGTFTLNLVQNGNDITGYLNKGSSATWSDYSLQVTSHSQTVLSAPGEVPPAGCPVIQGGIMDGGLDSGTISSTAILLNAHGRQVFSGSFTTDQLTLSINQCLFHSSNTCTPKNPTKHKITLTRQRN
ncbi:TPA: hypothetical protein HA318_00140 [Candidatus Micrarchaeota archaeon]|nr:hypothetical protein [Candidatus Micrarchaeota archaeon]